MATWQQYFRDNTGITAVPVSTKRPDTIRELLGVCQTVASEAGRKQNRIVMMVAGIPNVGKSTLINVLAGRSITKTGNEAALTRHQQRIELDATMVLMDTPGVLWPNVENRHSGFRLAATGAIRDTAISHSDVVTHLVKYLKHAYPHYLIKRFDIDPLPRDEISLLTQIGHKRGCLKSGGKVDIDRVAKIILTEFRDGTLGRICLETPEMMEMELAEVATIREQKEAKKRARKAKWKNSK